MLDFDKNNYIPNLEDALYFNKKIANDATDKTLKKLFTELCPENTCLEDILIKVATLNKLYSTNIFKVLPIAKHILSLSIDNRLNNGDASLVPQIAKVNINKKDYCFYSFATKYCAFHQPAFYNIYDSHVHNVLIHFSKRDKFMKLTHDSLKNYDCFCNALKTFQKHYHLEILNAWELDKYLWQLGGII